MPAAGGARSPSRPLAPDPHWNTCHVPHRIRRLERTQALPSEQARAVARALLDGFNKHYSLFRDCARAARRHFEAGNWLAIQHVARDRIDFYDRRVQETAERIAREFRSAHLDGADSDAAWAQVKLHYIGLLIDHRQPECAETFFNSVAVKVLHSAYFSNRFIFVRPVMSTEHIDADPPSYRSYYPLQQGLRHALIDIVLDFGFQRRFADFRRDLRLVLAAFRRRVPRPFRLEANHQIQVLSCPFFRNQTAYVVGRIVNGVQTYPFVVAVKHDDAGKLYLDALLMDEQELAILFSANRAYFLVDMEVPSAYVDFLRAIMPDKTASELYTMVGLQKAGKNLFYRDFLHHLKHSRDKFIVAPGIKGLVMTVFTLPSYPYVFKVIKDKIAASKDTDRERVKQKYTLVKHHDRVGRMTDILEYSDVAFPRERFSDSLLKELLEVVPSLVEVSAEHVVVKHLYIERRMTPLNLFLEKADDAQRAQAIREYGDALKDLAKVNIFAGDLLFKNFGVTRFGRVIFYDYDEIEYMVDMRVPADTAAAAGLRRHVERRLVSGRSAGRLSRGVRDLPAHRPEDARVLHVLPPRPPRRAVVAGRPGGAAQRPARRGALVFRRLAPQAGSSRDLRVAAAGSRRGRRLVARGKFALVFPGVPTMSVRTLPLALALVAIAAVAGGCQEMKKKEAEEAAKNTFACQLDGERLLVKFDAGEARLLLPGGERVILYQIAAASGVRFTNGFLELRGKGMELQLIRDSVVSPLVGCVPYVPRRAGLTGPPRPSASKGVVDARPPVAPRRAAPALPRRDGAARRRRVRAGDEERPDAADRGGDLRRRLLLVHGAAVRQARRRAGDDVGLHGRQGAAADLRTGLRGRDRARRGRPGPLRPVARDLRAPARSVLAQRRPDGEGPPVLRCRQPVPQRRSSSTTTRSAARPRRRGRRWRRPSRSRRRSSRPWSPPASSGRPRTTTRTTISRIRSGTAITGPAAGATAA